MLIASLSYCERFWVKFIHFFGWTMLNMLTLNKFNHLGLLCLFYKPHLFIHSLSKFDELCHKSISFPETSVVNLLNFNIFVYDWVILWMMNRNLFFCSELLLIFLLLFLHNLFPPSLYFFHYQNRISSSQILIFQQRLIILLTVFHWAWSRLKFISILLVKVTLEGFKIEPVIFIVVRLKYTIPLFFVIFTVIKYQWVDSCFL